MDDRQRAKVKIDSAIIIACGEADERESSYPQIVEAVADAPRNHPNPDIVAALPEPREFLSLVRQAVEKQFSGRLPLARQIFEEQKRLGSGQKPAEEAPASIAGSFEQWLKDNPPPDLQALVENAGRRYAASIGEDYDPLNPSHGGYQHITREEWEAHDRAMAVWERRRRERLRWRTFERHRSCRTAGPLGLDAGAAVALGRTGGRRRGDTCSIRADRFAADDAVRDRDARPVVDHTR